MLIPAMALIPSPVNPIKPKLSQQEIADLMRIKLAKLEKSLMREMNIKLFKDGQK